jgi:hypothetical protein
MPVTDSSAPVADVAVAEPEVAEPTEPAGPTDPSGATAVPRRSLVPPAMLALVIGAMSAVMLASHRSGHWWGDDWALYIRQAQSLLDGDPGRITADNLFTVDNSRGGPFSPPLYPWGFPMIMAPFVAVVGADVDRLTIVPVLCAAVFACCWYDLARRRLDVPTALVGVVAVTLTPLLLGWTELIQSEWPFLATTGVALVGLDRVVASNGLVNTSARVLPLVAIGVGAAAAFTVRREGLAMVAAIAAAQIAALATRETWTRLSDGQWRNNVLFRLFIPHVSALATVLVLQVALPSTLVPRYSGTSVGNVWKFRRDLVDNVAEISGLKRTWQDDPVVLGSAALGWFVVVAYLTAALGGVVLAFTVHRRRDLHIVGYVVAAVVIGGSFRSPINRYMVSVAPLLVLLALIALATAAGLVPWRHAPLVATTVVIALLALGNIVQARTRLDNARAFEDAGAVEWGPTHPAAVAMFDQVIARTTPDDVVAGPKARAMTLMTDRRAIQVDQYRPIPETLPFALIVAELQSETAKELATDTGNFTIVWLNDRFVIYQPSSAASASTNGDGSSSTASP